MERLGLSTLDCGRYVVANNPGVSYVFYRKYIYIPQQPSLNTEERTSISRDNFLNGFDPYTLISADDEKSNIALDSTVQLSNDDEAYFLMMDLQPSKSAENQRLIEARLRDQVTPYFGGGFLLESSNSYQYFGERIADNKGWLDFIGRSLLLSIVTTDSASDSKRFVEIPDTRYIGHSILRRSTGLRITTRDTKSFNPRSIAYIC